MSFFQDISPIFKKKELSFLESYKETGDIYTFIFEKEKDLHWKAGQHGVFSIIHKKIKKPTRPFSVASAPEENIVKITMGISDNPSKFKKAMLELKQGMKISMRGPIGPMYVNDNKPTLLIAGGIGITPFRSILKNVENGTNDREIVLLYIDSKGSFIYEAELNEIARNKAIKVNYLHSRDNLYREIDSFTSKYENNAKYYLAGTKSMVNSIVGYLKSHNISKGNIKKDAFIGYK